MSVQKLSRLRFEKQFFFFSEWRVNYKDIWWFTLFLFSSFTLFLYFFSFTLCYQGIKLQLYPPYSSLCYLDTAVLLPFPCRILVDMDMGAGHVTDTLGHSSTEIRRESDCCFFFLVNSVDLHPSSFIICWEGAVRVFLEILSFIIINIQTFEFLKLFIYLHLFLYIILISTNLQNLPLQSLQISKASSSFIIWVLYFYWIVIIYLFFDFYVTLDILIWFFMEY